MYEARPLSAVYAQAKTILQAAGCDTWALDARLLICAVLNLSHEAFIMSPDHPVAEDDNVRIDAFIAQRANGKPVAKITGAKEFYGRIFETTLDTLDPRPDTEILVATCLNVLPQQKSVRVLDLGTGTGCVVLSILAERPAAQGCAVDLSDKALAVAMRNAQRLDLGDRVTALRSDWFAQVTGTYDLIVSNPPYIPQADLEGLARDVKHYDPHLALDGGEDGLNPYRLIIPQALDYLNESGWLAFEVGVGQAYTVATLMERSGYQEVRVENDLAGIARAVCGKRA